MKKKIENAITGVGYDDKKFIRLTMDDGTTKRYTEDDGTAYQKAWKELSSAKRKAAVENRAKKAP